MDLGKLKLVILTKYAENKTTLSQLDLWSQIIKPNYFAFKTSSNVFKNIKFDSTIKVIENRIISGKLGADIEIPEIKLDDFIINKIEVIQDVEIKSDVLLYNSSCFDLKKEFNSRNSLNQKELIIFDIKHFESELNFKLLSDKAHKEYIELVVNLD